MVKRTILTLVAVLFSGLSLARADTIEEISVGPLDTVFTYVPSPITDSTLKMEQSGVTVTVRRSDNSLEQLLGAHFSLETFLKEDHSAGGIAAATFEGGSMTIRDSLDVLRLSAGIGQLTVEEDAALPLYTLTGWGEFTATDGEWKDDFGPESILFDTTWRMDADIESLDESFATTADMTLARVPEPCTLCALAVGGLLLVRRRFRKAA